MGSPCAVTVIGGPARALALAAERAADLEQRWSRFRDSSELSRLNASPGTACRVSHDTFLLIDHGVAAHRLTSGRFDPTVLDILERSGYDRSFEHIGHRPAPERQLRPAPGCKGIELHAANRTVTLPPGVRFDPGGLGKGLAADLIVEALLDVGVDGACVSMGGDVRVSGEAPAGGWRIGIANPTIEDDLLCAVLLVDQGLATSNRLVRRWSMSGQERNHLVNPRTAAPCHDLLAASIIAGQTWWAEVLTKVAMVDFASTRLTISLLGGEGLFVDADQRVAATAGFARFDARNADLAR